MISRKSLFLSPQKNHNAFYDYVDRWNIVLSISFKGVIVIEWNR